MQNMYMQVIWNNFVVSLTMHTLYSTYTSVSGRAATDMLSQCNKDDHCIYQ